MPNKSMVFGALNPLYKGETILEVGKVYTLILSGKVILKDKDEARLMLEYKIMELAGKITYIDHGTFSECQRYQATEREQILVAYSRFELEEKLEHARILRSIASGGGEALEVAKKSQIQVNFSEEKESNVNGGLDRLKIGDSIALIVLIIWVASLLFIYFN